MNELNDITMFDDVDGFVDCKVVPVRTFDDPPVVHVFVTVAGNLK
jgi:hypothetical protein